MLLDILVHKVDARSNPELVWHVRMDNRVFKDSPFINWPLQYGEKIPNTLETVSAKTLHPGHYRLQAGVYLVNMDGSRQNEPARILLSEFWINSDLRLRQEEDPSRARNSWTPGRTE